MSYRVLAVAGALIMGGCAASIPPVQVTRFHLSGDIARDTVSAALGADTLEAGSYRAAVERELNRVGFPSAGAAAATYVFTADVNRDTRAALAARSPVTIGIGGGTGGYGGGIGLGASFGVGGNRSREVVVTQLAVQLRRRADQTVVWEGRAETQAPGNSPAAQPSLAADKLAAALFKDFPGETGRTISVP
ncbi:MAG: DUF4136 domain-containing protein [Sphingomonadaceae bacterium]